MRRACIEAFLYSLALSLVQAFSIARLQPSMLGFSTADGRHGGIQQLAICSDLSRCRTAHAELPTPWTAPLDLRPLPPQLHPTDHLRRVQDPSSLDTSYVAFGKSLLDFADNCFAAGLPGVGPSLFVALHRVRHTRLHSLTWCHAEVIGPADTAPGPRTSQVSMDYLHARASCSCISVS